MQEGGNCSLQMLLLVFLFVGITQIWLPGLNPMSTRKVEMDVEKVVLNNVCLKRLLELHCFKREDALVEGMLI